jgi:HK97 family phage prohead protease
MKNPTILKAESQQGFQFSFQIEKSTVQVDNKDLILTGVASTTNVDHDNERMDEGALKRMVNIVNTQGVPLRWEHSKDPSAVLGTVFKGHVDERGQMHISAKLNPEHPLSKELHDAVARGERYGLSVGGKILNAVKEIAEGAGKYVKTFYDVLLDEVSVTKKPANYDAWLTTTVAKSANADRSYSRFLFENQQFDYMAQIAKSIPADAWKTITKLSVNHIKNMPEEKKDEVVVEAEKSFVTKAQFEQFTSQVLGMLKAIGSEALDTANPNKKKEEVETQQTAKAEDREGQENDGGNGTIAAEGKKEGDEPAKDTTNPDKSKAADETQQTAKKEESFKDWAKEEAGEEEHKAEDGAKEEDEAEKAEGEEVEGEEKEKAEEGEKDEEVKEKAEDGEKLPKDLKNAMKSIGDAIKVIDTMTKKMKGIKSFVKSEHKGISELDAFAVTVADYCDAVQERLAKSQKSVPGYTQAIVDQIKTDPTLQAEIRKMMKEPGAKKSVAFGSPFMMTKDGKKYSLTATPVEETVAKSQYTKDSKVDFKTLYKSKYSAIREAEGKE